MSWGVAVAAIVFGFAGYASSWLALINDKLGNRYLSTAVMTLNGGTPADVADLEAQALSRTNLSSVINDPHLLLYRDELKYEPLDAVIRKLRQHLTITQLGDRSSY